VQNDSKGRINGLFRFSHPHVSHNYGHGTMTWLIGALLKQRQCLWPISELGVLAEVLLPLDGFEAV
jgi:hypothetical protein